MGTLSGVMSGVLSGMLLGACGGGPVVTPAPAPLPPAVIPEPERAPARVLLPARIGATTWQVSTRAQLGAGEGPQGEQRDEQRIESRALVTWTLDRTSDGALRGTGQVDSFTVRSTLDSSLVSGTAGSAGGNRAPALLLLDAIVDSVSHRVVTRPLLANECDRPELGAVALAREVLVRIPDGVAIGDRWRDSTVSLVCRTGVPITVRSLVQSVVERIETDRVVVRRTMEATLEGKGGTAFRAFDVTGSSNGTQQVTVNVSSGALETMEGTSILTLQVSERMPSGTPRTQQIVQRLDVKAERVAR